MSGLSSASEVGDDTVRGVMRVNLGTAYVGHDFEFGMSKVRHNAEGLRSHFTRVVESGPLHSRNELSAAGPDEWDECVSVVSLSCGVENGAEGSLATDGEEVCCSEFNSLVEAIRVSWACIGGTRDLHEAVSIVSENVA